MLLLQSKWSLEYVPMFAGQSLVPITTAVLYQWTLVDVTLPHVSPSHFIDQYSGFTSFFMPRPDAGKTSKQFEQRVLQELNTKLRGLKNGFLSPRETPTSGRHLICDSNYTVRFVSATSLFTTFTGDALSFMNTAAVCDISMLISPGTWVQRMYVTVGRLV